MTDDYRARNDAASRRLCELVRRLTDADLDRSLGEGWTVKAALAHMAFWDRVAGASLDRWTHSSFAPSGEDDASFINIAGLPDWLAAPPQYARTVVVAAAEATDRVAASVSDSLRGAIEAGGESWALNRHVHRTEHIEQIEQALAAADQRAP